MTAAEDRLLEHLASQAGLVLRNVRLTAELQATIDDLRASRRRLVEAQDEERQRIERNLHDGAQQQLVALTVQLSLLEDSAEDPGEVRQTGTASCGPGCARHWMTCAPWPAGSTRRCSPTKGSGQPCTRRRARPRASPVDADGIGRYPRDTEAAAYFCILEALQNVAKYSRASRATIALACPDGHLEFTVTDDGDGFDTAKATHGTGLQGMADRLAAVGGALHIHSTPGLGTTISGTLPAAEMAETAARHRSGAGIRARQHHPRCGGGHRAPGGQ